MTKKISYGDLMKLGGNLTPYIELEGSEVGEAGMKLIELISSTDFYSDEFNKLIKEELELMLLNFENNSRIIKRTITREETITELEWDGIDY